MNRIFFIAGVQFRPKADIDRATRHIKIGGILRLEPEPSNKFDPNAIQIIYGGCEECDGAFLGYVPKKFSSEVTAFLEIGADIECIVEAVNPAAKTYEMIKVVIREVSDEVDDRPDESDDRPEEGGH